MADQQCIPNSRVVECLPLKTLEEVLMWNPPSPKFHSDRLQERVVNKGHPRTLVCHDMKGGYLEDRLVQGAEQEDCYNFIHWSVVDIFVYFSHHLVTLPPCGWISAAHRNGTLILGTFITEWDDGLKCCEDFLKDSESVHRLCDQLVDIATFYGFDGWLINIENKIQPHQIEHLEEFVHVLTEKQHSTKSSSLVIWYDSVIKTGELKWQNCLNENNRSFFAGCDGIFLNYTWNDEHLKQSVLEAGSRKTDVYVGVDVFGRGCRGNGGFCTNVAVKAARDHGFSVAIFAPGWVYECLDVKDFWENQYKFWDLLTELCHPLSFKSLPFSTTFCAGCGKKMFRKGKIISQKPWFNLGLQQPQPTYHYIQAAPHGASATICVDDAYSGGSCLKLSGIYRQNVQHTFGIFKSSFTLEGSFIISYTFKPVEPHSANVALVLNMSISGKTYSLHLTDGEAAEKEKNPPAKEENPTTEEDNPGDGPSCNGTDPLCSQKIKYPATESELLAFSVGNMQPFYIENGWITRTYILPVCDFRYNVIQCVDARISCSAQREGLPYIVLLGNFTAFPVEEESVPMSCKNVWQTVANEKTYLHCFLEWVHNASVHSWDIFYSLGGNSHYLGTTTQSFYKVIELELYEEIPSSSAKSKIEFSVHGQSINGIKRHSVSACL